MAATMAALVAADSARFLFVLAPRYHHWNTTECPHNWERVEYSNDEPYQFAFLDYFAREAAADMPVLELLPAFKAANRAKLVFADDPHWNEHGNAFVAGLLARRIVDDGLLSPH